MPSDDRWELFSMLFVDEDEKDNVAIGVGCGRRSFSYYRLPESLLKLSVLKLDGSSFEVKIARTASVRELKRGVENVFRQLPPKEGGVKISWSHVWSYFCLCYEGRKLTDDRASLQSLGIKDGIQLHFVRHLSVDYNPPKRQPRNHGAASKMQHRRSLTAPEVLERFEGGSGRDSSAKVSPSQSVDEKFHDYDKMDEQVVGWRKEFGLSHLLRGWFSYTRLRSSTSRRSDGRLRSFLRKFSKSYYQR